MDMYWYLFWGAILFRFSHAAVVLRPISNINLPYAYSADGTGLFGIEKDAVEQIGYDEENGLVYAAGSTYIHVVDYSNLTDPVIVKAMASNNTINDVEQCGSRVGFAVMGDTLDQPGEVHVYDIYDRATGSFDLSYPPITVGFEPDMLHFTKDCNTIVVANEASPYETQSDVIDPEGSVSIIRFQQTSPPVVTTLDFTSFNERADEYLTEGIHLHYQGELSLSQSNFSQIMEPEYVTFNMDETKAYIALQENNAIAEVNLVTDSIDEIYSLGIKSWKNLVMDSSDKDSGINLQSYDILSFYQPDSIYLFEFNGNSYIVTANEGETVELEAGDEKWSNAKRGRKLVKDEQVSADIDADLQEALSDDTRLGRLEFSVVDGLSTTDPSKIDRLHFFGARGISLFRADNMSLVWDSGDMIERLHSETYPSTFNANSKPDDPSAETPMDLMDKRSDNHGPGCEALTIGEIEDNTHLIFVGVGRSSTIIIYRLAATFDGGHVPVLEFESMFRAGGINDTFNVLLENGNLGNLDPEDLRFISARHSPTDTPLLLVAGTTSGNLVMYEVVDEGNEEMPSVGLGVHATYRIIVILSLAMGWILAILK